MKKVISFVLCFVLIFCAASVSAFAATPNEQLKSDVSAVIPDDFNDICYPQFEKIIDQVEITEDQYTQLKAILDETVDKIDLSKGISIHNYSESERTYLLSQFGKALDILGLTYELVTKTNSEHEGDVYAIIYDADGNKLGTIDGDIHPSKTDSAVPAWAWALIAVAIAVLAGGAVVYTRRRKIAE